LAVVLKDLDRLVFCRGSGAYSVQERLTARASKVIAVAAAPGAATTQLQKTTCKAGFGLQAGLGLVMKLGQTEDDGAMPLLHCTGAPDIKAGRLYVPQYKGLIGWLLNDGYVGPPVEKAPEAQATKKQVVDMLWQRSEAACGPFFH
jgi:hypothetical protein